MKFSIYSFFRYLFLLALGLFGFNLIYSIFTPITSYPSLFLLKIIYSNASLNGLNEIIINDDKIMLIEACIAGAAYYFLALLNLTTPMSFTKRFRSILFLIFTFLLANILRIVLFSVLYLEGFKFFDVAHLGVWYFGSTLFVVIIWFWNVKLFSIKDIPVYSDFKVLFSYIFIKKNNKKKKK